MKEMRLTELMALDKMINRENPDAVIYLSESDKKTFKALSGVNCVVIASFFRFHRRNNTPEMIEPAEIASQRLQNFLRRPTVEESIDILKFLHINNIKLNECKRIYTNEVDTDNCVSIVTQHTINNGDTIEIVKENLKNLFAFTSVFVF